jgi:hypothetical protein
MNSKPKQYEDDDGRVICNMDVPGMRWHDKRVKQEEREARRVASRPTPTVEQMTKSEARRYTWYALMAGWLIVAIFSVAWILFTLFCTQIWFR